MQLTWAPAAERGSLAVSVDSRVGLPLPAGSPTIHELFPGETVTFSLANLAPDARRELRACFAPAGPLMPAHLP